MDEYGYPKYISTTVTLVLWKRNML